MNSTVNVVSYLVNLDVDLNVIDNDHNAPIHYAIKRTNLKIVRMILDRIDPNKTYFKNRNLLHYIGQIYNNIKNKDKLFTIIDYIINSKIALDQEVMMVCNPFIIFVKLVIFRS